MDFSVNNAHIARWLKEFFEEMIDNNLRSHCLSLHNCKILNEEVQKEIVSLMISELGDSGKIIDANNNCMLVAYNGFYFSVNMEHSNSKTCDILEFDIISFRELAEALEDYKLIDL